MKTTWKILVIILIITAISQAQFKTWGGKSTEWAVVFKEQNQDTQYLSIPVDQSDRWNVPPIYDKIKPYRYDKSGDERNIPSDVREFVRSKGYDYGDRIGFHDPTDGSYFTLMLNRFGLQHHEIQGTVSLVAVFEIDSLTERRKSKLEKPAPSERSYWRVCAAWKPLQKDRDLSFHPDNYSGVRQLKRITCEEPSMDRFTWLGDSLVKRGLSANTGNDSLVLMKTYPGDDNGDIDFYQVEYIAVTDTVKSIHRVIIQRIREQYRIASTATSRFPMGLSDDEYWKAESNEFLYHRESVNILGIVDLDFNGLYELMLSEHDSDLGDTHGSWGYYILDCSGEKPRRIGRELGGSSC